MFFVCRLRKRRKEPRLSHPVRLLAACALAVLLPCGCGRTETASPRSAELPTCGTYEAETPNGTFTGSFECDGPRCTVTAKTAVCAPFTLVFNGEKYEVTSGGRTFCCSADAFPAHSFWRALPVLMQLAAAHGFCADEADDASRMTSVGRITWSADARGNILSLAFPADSVVLRLKSES